MNPISYSRSRHKQINRNRDGARWRDLMLANMDIMWDEGQEPDVVDVVDVASNYRRDKDGTSYNENRLGMGEVRERIIRCVKKWRERCFPGLRQLQEFQELQDRLKEGGRWEL